MLIQRKIFRILLAVALSTVLLVGTLHAQTITGEVVGVADGDTITVLQDRTQYKIRLYGIDTPEGARISVTGPNNSHLVRYSASRSR